MGRLSPLHVDSLETVLPGPLPIPGGSGLWDLRVVLTIATLAEERRVSLQILILQHINEQLIHDIVIIINALNAMIIVNLVFMCIRL